MQKSLQMAFSWDLVHLYPTSTPNASNFHFLEGTGFLTNNLNLQEHTSLKHTYFYSNYGRYWSSGKCRLPKHTAAFINSLFHWEVHLGLLEKANNNKACCYIILPKSFSQIPTKITFLHAPLTVYLEAKFVGGKSAQKSQLQSCNKVHPVTVFSWWYQLVYQQTNWQKTLWNSADIAISEITCTAQHEVSQRPWGQKEAERRKLLRHWVKHIKLHLS